MKVLFLGSGTSYGVPMIGCDCAVCRSPDPRNRRSRASILLQTDGKNVLIDASPDLREQMLRHDIKTLDAILLTHPHADHILGLDDVRAFTARQDKPLPLYGDEDTLRIVHKNLDYVFGNVTPSAHPWDVPRMESHALDGSAIDVEGINVLPVPILHGCRPILAYRIGDFAYATDCSGIPDASMPLLQGLDTLVIGAVKHDPHPTHFSIGQALEMIAQLSPRRAFLTHISHRLDHAGTEASLPAAVRLAYDGLSVEVPAQDSARRGEDGA
jgi:phosphoribosyl 1,2-cyclic phosphate phosphodiesterase